jgi:hypothetical protein
MVINKEQMMIDANDLTRVMSKARKHSPSVPTKYLVKLVRGKSIHVFYEQEGVIVKGTRFEMGDQAEYDSFNLSYLGQITSITEKSVTITAYKGSSNERNHRLDLDSFCWRNHNFDLERVRRENAEASYNI